MDPDSESLTLFFRNEDIFHEKFFRFVFFTKKFLGFKKIGDSEILRTTGRVSESGQGVDPEFRVFDSFFRNEDIFHEKFFRFVFFAKKFLGFKKNR